MRMGITRLPALLAVCLLATRLGADEIATGWRGNGTGLWPEATVPTTWGRVARGAMEGLRARADRPDDPTRAPDDAAAPLVEKGLVRPWLVIGPFPVTDSLAELDKDPLGGEAAVAPAAGEKVGKEGGEKIGELAWKPLTGPADDPYVFGTSELPWLDVAKELGFARNQLVYAHTWLYSPRGGPVRVVAQHGEGMKLWLNGEEVYRRVDRAMTLGWYHGLSRLELDHVVYPSAKIELNLKPGWNRLLVKLSSPKIEGCTDTRFVLRLMDPPDVAYESENIRWMTELPGRSTSTPIRVGGRIFLMAEPDELICLDKETGKILWSSALNYLEALPPEQRAALPALAERVDPLVAELRGENDRRKRLELRASIQKTLEEIDRKTFHVDANDHFEAHFNIVGFTMPTPLSDGKRVYAWCGLGIAACFELDGTRRWITRVPSDHLQYGASPALADGVLAVFLGELYGLDAESGKELWKQHRVKRNIAAVMAGRFRGENVFISQAGEIIRPADGELLFRPRGYSSTSDTGWSPPVTLGEKLYVPRYGVAHLNIYDFAAPDATLKAPALEKTIELPPEIGTLPNGQGVDRWTAGSPLIWDGLWYTVDIYQCLYVAELASGKMTHRAYLPMAGYMHYNSVPVAASPTLVGKHVMAFDNQGTGVVLEPGPTPRVVAVNRIETQLERDYPLPGQETLTYAPPLVDGARMYLRGERFLYCVEADTPARAPTSAAGR